MPDVALSPAGFKFCTTVIDVDNSVRQGSGSLSDQTADTLMPVR